MVKKVKSTKVGKYELKKRGLRRATSCQAVEGQLPNSLKAERKMSRRRRGLAIRDSGAIFYA